MRVIGRQTFGAQPWHFSNMADPVPVPVAVPMPTHLTTPSAVSCKGSTTTGDVSSTQSSVRAPVSTPNTTAVSRETHRPKPTPPVRRVQKTLDATAD
ncbi:hypothetical protein BDW68DRAFT_175961 [Aspergillus falconensis]